MNENQNHLPEEDGTKLDKNNEVDINVVSLGNLCRGFLNLYVDDLKSITGPLDEVDRNQAVLIETVQQENARFVDAKQTCSLEEMKRTLKLQALKEREIAQKSSTQ